MLHHPAFPRKVSAVCSGNASEQNKLVDYVVFNGCNLFYLQLRMLMSKKYKH